MNIVLFEDNEVSQLYPITLSRPAYGITCGAFRLVDLLALLADKLDATLSGKIRAELEAFQGDYFPKSATRSGESTLWVNARAVPDIALLNTLESAIRDNTPFQSFVNGQLALALLPAGATWTPVSKLDIATTDSECRLFESPHQVIGEHTNVIESQLAALVNFSEYQEVSANVFSRGNPSIHPNAVFDTTNGPIMIEGGATISPFAVLQGPIRIGHGSFVAPHSWLKGPLFVGEHCKVGGEISKTVIESYSNKVHYGYLGSSYVGSWVNLGAGTTNSNLKNTYGTVRVEYESGRQETGMQFLGCIIGDYTKTAINTSIYTGKVLGVCSNVYGTVTTNVPSFANYARSLGEVTEHPAAVMEVTQKRVFERRGLQQQDRDKQLIRDMYAIEAPKRKLANQPPSL